MKKLAYILFPKDIEHLKNLLPIGKIMPVTLAKMFIKDFSPFRISSLDKTYALDGSQIRKYTVVCPIIDSNISGDQDLVVRFIEAMRLIKETGADIVGLERNVPFIIKNIKHLNKKNRVPISCGDALGAWSVFEAIFRTVKVKNLSLRNLNVAIIGADMPIGNLLARKLAGLVSRITLCGKNSDKLGQLKNLMPELGPAKTVIKDNSLDTARGNDIVILTKPVVDSVLAEIKPQAIVCGISLPADMVKKIKKYPEIIFVEAGLIKLPGSDEIVDFSLAETMLLVLEDGFSNFLPSDNINLDNLEDVADMATRHGFEVWVPQAPLV